MRRRLVSFILMAIDMVIVALVPFIALLIRFDGIGDNAYFNMILSNLLAVVGIRLAIFYLFGMYNRLWKYASISELVAIVSAVTVSSVIIFTFTSIMGIIWPRSLHLLSWLICILLVGLSRLALRLYSFFRYHYTNRPNTNVLIVGAGDAGAVIAKEIRHTFAGTKKIIGFIDDDKYKQKQLLLGYPILGMRENIQTVVDAYSVDEIIIAMPSVSGGIIRDIAQQCKATGCKVQIVPGIYELIDGNVSLSQLRDINLEDLLRRDPVRLNTAEIAGYLKEQRVLVTGAGGSIGSELCRQICRFQPKQLILLGKGENSIYEIHQELKVKCPEIDVVPVIADVRDAERINQVFLEYQPQVVLHAAAHKHVPLMEAHPIEAVKNNIFGTKNVAEAADRTGVKVFIMISTDKAVNPTSVMGASKRVAELVIQNMSKVSATRFAAVRFGNVLGSRGSVIPLFKKQIARGGPITITHPDMKRYFMTIPEATQLVLQAGALAKGGEVFVLDMGEPVKIVDMACDLIELSGLRPYKDIPIEFCGLRPGEKLFEELLTAEEGTRATKHEKIFVANLKEVDEEKLQRGLLILQSVKQTDEIIAVLSNFIPTYQSSRNKSCTDMKNEEGAVEKTAGKAIRQYKVVMDVN